MVRYFKVNDPYRLLTLFLFIVVVRVAVLSLGFPFTGLHSSYFSAELHAQHGPLFVWLIQLLDLLFSEPTIPSAVLSGLLVTLQAFSLNSILINNKALQTNTYLPAACYVIVMSSSPEFILVSPALCAITFVLIGINNMLFHLQYRGSEENIISTGFVFGLAALFDPSSTIFIVLVYVIYLAYSNTLNRRYLLIAFGFLFPFIITWLYFMWQNEGGMFWSHFAINLVSIDQEVLVEINQLLLLMGLPLLIMLVSSSQTFTGVGLTNHQIATQRTMLFLGLFAVFSILINDRISANSTMYVVPSIAFFCSQFMLTRERSVFAEITFLVVLVWSLGFLLMPVLELKFSPIDYSLLK